MSTPIQQSIESLRQGILTGFTNVGSALRTTNTTVAGKVDKVEGFGLSQENYTAAEKTKLAGLESSRFKGEFTSLAALQAAFPTASVGDYANVDQGEDADVVRFIWDSSDAKWVMQLGASTQMTGAQIKSEYESQADTNAYTDAEKASVATIGTLTSTLTDTVAQVATNTGAISELTTELGGLGSADFVGAFETALNA